MLIKAGQTNDTTWREAYHHILVSPPPPPHNPKFLSRPNLSRLIYFSRYNFRAGWESISNWMLSLIVSLTSAQKSQSADKNCGLPVEPALWSKGKPCIHSTCQVQLSMCSLMCPGCRSSLSALGDSTWDALRRLSVVKYEAVHRPTETWTAARSLSSQPRGPHLWLL